jgi:hypothetical protein
MVVAQQYWPTDVAGVEGDVSVLALERLRVEPLLEGLVDLIMKLPIPH